MRIMRMQWTQDYLTNHAHIRRVDEQAILTNKKMTVASTRTLPPSRATLSAFIHTPWTSTE